MITTSIINSDVCAYPKYVLVLNKPVILIFLLFVHHKIIYNKLRRLIICSIFYVNIAPEKLNSLFFFVKLYILKSTSNKNLRYLHLIKGHALRNFTGKCSIVGPYQRLSPIFTIELYISNQNRLIVASSES